MESKKLKIGRIPYANLFPIFHYLDRKCIHSEYRYIKGVPSRLNKLLRDGELDISPSSSIEYLRNKNKYFILPWFSISSFGHIKSILLFSKLPINELGGKTIAVSSESETSPSLLRIILKEFLSLRCKFKTTNQRSVKNILLSFSAVLLIGDTAMMEAKKLSNPPSPPLLKGGKGGLFTKRGQGRNRHVPNGILVYDLGGLWDKYTGLPFVYALWVVRKKSILHKGELIKKLATDLINAKKYVNKKFSLIAKEAPQKKWISEKELVDYWKIISYDFTEKHLEGLTLFEKYALKSK